MGIHHCLAGCSEMLQGLTHLLCMRRLLVIARMILPLQVPEILFGGL